MTETAVAFVECERLQPRLKTFRERGVAGLLPAVPGDYVGQKDFISPRTRARYLMPVPPHFELIAVWLQIEKCSVQLVN